MSLDRCPRRGTPHPPHPIRLYFSPGVVSTTCPGEGEPRRLSWDEPAPADLMDTLTAETCLDHERPLPCLECAND